MRKVWGIAMRLEWSKDALEDLDNFREWFYKDYTIIYEIVDKAIIIHEVHNQKKFFIGTITRD